jgi:hypothetical protein
MLMQMQMFVESGGAHGDRAALPARLIAAKGALPMHGANLNLRSLSLIERG